jgi:type IV secretory pathway VirD2 relaxase
VPVDDEFRLWLGEVGRDPPLRGRLRKAARQAGRMARAARGRARRFDGSRIGRGSGTARVLGSAGGARDRRVVVKVRLVRLAGKGARAAAAHLRYLQRDGTTRDGERGSLYGADHDDIDGKAFLERGTGDRHQFRLIVSAEDGARYDDLKPMTRQLMRQMEEDLGTRLEWAAVDHFNTGQPHTHIVLRGIDDAGRNLVIAREYITRGIAARAVGIVGLDLGPRTDREVALAASREIDAERFTGIDRRLLRASNAERFVSAWHGEPREQALRAGRLTRLARMGLAREAGKGLYRLGEDLERHLREIARRGDIAALMDHALRGRAGIGLEHAVFDPAEGREVVGNVIAQGLADEHSDRRYLIVEGAGGGVHYVELAGEALAGPVDQRIVRVAARPAQVREADRTVAAIAAANGGIYSSEAHRRHEPSASPAYAAAHVRRLEALRRGGAGVERLADGSWTVAPDHLERVLAWERARTARSPVTVELLSDRPLAQLVRHDGATWLDEQCVASVPERLGGAFGGRVQAALVLRRQWLVEQGLASERHGVVRVQAGLLRVLHRRELQRVAAGLARDLGLDYAEHAGGRVEGTLRQAVQAGRAKYALVERGHQFTLVPWRAVLEKRIGRQVSGIDRGGSIGWTFGRGRSGPEI